MYTAELKRPISQSHDVKKAAVEELIDVLALEGCRNVLIGSALSKGISGGQVGLGLGRGWNGAGWGGLGADGEGWAGHGAGGKGCLGWPAAAGATCRCRSRAWLCGAGCKGSACGWDLLSGPSLRPRGEPGSQLRALLLSRASTLPPPPCAPGQARQHRHCTCH